MKVYLEPDFGDKEDPGDGGVRRVVEALRRHLPDHGVEFVVNPEQADLIHVHIAPMAGTERFLKSRVDMPYVLSSHGYYWLEYEWPPWALKANRMCLAALRMADHTIAPSEWVAQTIRRNSLRPTTPLPHGIEADDWPTNHDKKNYVLWNKTRVDPICDPAPVSELAKRMPDVEFVSTYANNKSSNIRVTGLLPYKEALELVNEAGLYLCTTRETFGIGTLEAMAAGVPVVGWNWGGQREFVKTGVTGWLANPGDYEGLVKGIRYCLDHQKEMGEAARKVAFDYQWSGIIPAYIEIYEKVIAAKKHTGPKVSIIVPAYGLEDTLFETLESIASQAPADWECIVIDDASPDKCGEIADNYAAADTHFRVIHNEENQYLAGALNTGIAAAKGKYILPVDADNLLPKDAVKFLTEALEKDRALHIAYGNVEFLDPDGKKWHSGWPPEFRAEWQIHRNDSQDKASNLIPSGSMFRKEVWEATGGYRRRWKTAEDADFWTRAVSYGFTAERITTTDVMIYRNREESMSRKEETLDWSNWYPWCRNFAAPPAAIDYLDYDIVPSYEPVLITVVIPVGPGHEQLVIDAVDSVDAQTFRLWECIVVNDTGFPLPTLPNWVRQIDTVGSLGVAAARNVGLREAKSSLFIPLDADDTLESTALARMFEVWQEHKDYVYPDWYERWDEKDARPTQVWECDDYDATFLLKKGCLHAVTALYPLSAWKDVGGFDESLSAWEDWDFQLGLAKLGICGIHLPEPLFTYRKSTGMRREENYSEFESSKQGIVDKWGPYFTGGEELMACSSCRKKSLPKPKGTMTMSQSAAAQRSDALADEEGTILIEYIGRRTGSMNYKGPSGQFYRFGSSEGETKKLVKAGDADHFMSMVDFRRVEKETPVGATI